MYTLLLSYMYPQIIPPHDKGISACIMQNTTPWPTSWDTTVLKSNPLISDPLETVRQEYFTSLQQYCFRSSTNPSTTIKFTYTPMHGVGLPFVKQVFKAFRLPEFIPVKEQVSSSSTCTCTFASEGSDINGYQTLQNMAGMRGMWHC